MPLRLSRLSSHSCARFTSQPSTLIALYSPRLHRIVPHEEHPEALSYALHFYAEGEVHLQDILSNTGLRLADLLTKQFGEAVLGFSTIMHVVD